MSQRTRPGPVLDLLKHAVIGTLNNARDGSQYFAGDIYATEAEALSRDWLRGWRGL